MRKKLSLLLAIPALLIAGCTKSLSNGELDVTKNNPGIFSEADHNSEVVSMLCGLPLNYDVCSEVAAVVEQSVRCGLDEDFMFRELWAPETKIASARSPLLKQQIEGYLNSTAETKSGSCSFENLLKTTDISIYWPYCEDWDGETLPTITCPPKDESQEWNYGYRLSEKDGSVELEVVKVDEEYAMENPVWIIKDTDYDYSDLPFFINGEYCAHGVTYLPEQSGPSNNVQTKAGGAEMHGWLMSSMTVLKQYDKMFWNGGSEFKIAASFPTATGYTGSTNTFTTSFTRKQIRQKTTKYFNTNLNSDNVLNYDWKENQYSNGLAIWEVNGKKSTTDYTLGCTLQTGDKTKVTLSATVKISPKDELIVSREYTRGFMFSSSGRLSQNYNDNNVKCTYIIKDYN